MNGIHEVRGSIPLGSTNPIPSLSEHLKFLLKNVEGSLTWPVNYCRNWVMKSEAGFHTFGALALSPERRRASRPSRRSGQSSGENRASAFRSRSVAEFIRIVSSAS
jgi:hypothetical protein